MMLVATCLIACATTSQPQANNIQKLLQSQKEAYEHKIKLLKKYPKLASQCGTRVHANRNQNDGPVKTAVKLSKALTRANDEKVACYRASEKNRKNHEER